jgi:hypothetical protein
MKQRQLPLLALALLATTALAKVKWELIAQTNEVAYFAFPSTRIHKGENSLMWSLYNFSDKQLGATGNYLSQKVHYEFDCQHNRIRQLYFSLHTGSMGSGEPVLMRETPNNPWEAIPAGTINSRLLEAACRLGH